MNKFIRCFLACILVVTTFYAQKNDALYGFYDENELLGFKDASGNVIIPPLYGGIPHRISKIETIAAVSEQKGDSLEIYYLLKNGEKITNFDVYIDESDLRFDCESEGFIRYKDTKKDAVGMLNSEGNVQIPAEYNEILPFQNGYTIALKNATKQYWTDDGLKDEHAGCNHWHWEGGNFVLIDTENKILVENLPESHFYLNLFSFQKTKEKVLDKHYESFAGTDGNYYSFLNYKEEFTSFFYDTFLKDSKNPKYYFTIVSNMNEDGDITTLKESARIQSFHQLVFNHMNHVDFEQNNKIVFIEKADYLMYHESTEAYFREYFTNCYTFNFYKFPLFRVSVTDHQNVVMYYISFLRTQQGYQLVEF